VDLAGVDRLVDGDGDGHAQLDIGAYEFQPQPDAPAGPSAGDSSTPPSGEQHGADVLQEQPRPGSDQAVGAPQGTPAALPLRLAPSGKALRVDRKGRATLSVRCQAGSACRLSVALTGRVHGRSVTLARGSAASSGSGARIQLRLSRRSIALARRYRVRSVRAAVSAHDVTGATTTASRAYALRFAR
jgi:hypothetical protein